MAEVWLFTVAFALAFFGALRIGELVCKNRCGVGGLQFLDVTVDGDCVWIHIGKSKTDQLGKGVTVSLFWVLPDSVCPVSSVQRFLEVRGLAWFLFAARGWIVLVTLSVFDYFLPLFGWGGQIGFLVQYSFHSCGVGYRGDQMGFGSSDGETYREARVRSFQDLCSPSFCFEITLSVFMWFYVFFWFSLSDLPPGLDLGGCICFLGALRADAQPEGRQLGISRSEGIPKWLGILGMMWGRVLPECHYYSRVDRPPDVLVLQVGGNYLGVRAARDLVRDVKFDILCLILDFPGCIIIWSDIGGRKVWRFARSIGRLNKARIKLNREIGRFIAWLGGIVVRHRELEDQSVRYWWDDGVHLNAVGTDIWSLGLQEC